MKKEKEFFFIGPSGVGKSTILESLGLMNNTIQANSNSVFDFLGESFIDIWDKGEAELKKKRNENFSFIFQSNNLFGSMTGYQNIISGAIINGEHEISSLKRKSAIIVGELLSDLNIKSGEDFNIFEMSGGQKQRVAFARAIIANKDILFADEPTGNLDWYNAEKLMMYLDVKLGSEKTAIIVTHDIELALKFATKIVLIDKKCEIINGEENYYGIIDTNSIYSKKDNTWTNASEDKTLEKVRSEIRSKFIPKKI